jgi:hypothetical protein
LEISGTKAVVRLSVEVLKLKIGTSTDRQTSELIIEDWQVFIMLEALRPQWEETLYVCRLLDANLGWTQSLKPKPICR